MIRFQCGIFKHIKELVSGKGKISVSKPFKGSEKLIWPLLTRQSGVTYINMTENRFMIGYAKMGTSGCKKCKTKIEKGALRIAKVVANPFTSEGGDMKQWHHPACLFDTFKRARATTKKVEEPDDLEGFGELKQEDKDEINKLIKGIWQR